MQTQKLPKQQIFDSWMNSKTRVIRDLNHDLAIALLRDNVSLANRIRNSIRMVNNLGKNIQQGLLEANS
jgi:hypothetical protein